MKPLSLASHPAVMRVTFSSPIRLLDLRRLPFGVWRTSFEEVGMCLLKALGIVVLAMCAVALASEKNLGIHKVADVSFEAAVQVGTTVIPAGQYKVRHTMDGQDHVMTFTRNGRNEVYKVKCTLVALA